MKVDGNAATGSIWPQRAERKIKPPLIFEVDKPNAVPASSKRQIDPAARSKHKITAVSIAVRVMEASVPDKNLSMCHRKK